MPVGNARLRAVETRTRTRPSVTNCAGAVFHAHPRRAPLPPILERDATQIGCGRLEVLRLFRDT